MRKMFPKYKKNIVADKDAKTIINIAEKLYKEGFDEMIMVIKKIKTSLKAELLDDAGSTLSIQRERYIREEVIEYMLKSKKNSPTYD